MMRKFLLSGLGFGALAILGSANAAIITPFEACLNIDGTIYEATGDAPCFGSSDIFGGVTDGITDGLGSLTVTVTGAGDHYVGMFVDWEIDEFDNTWFNEFGGGGLGSDPDGVASGEVDEPGYNELGYEGDIYWNFLDGALDDSVFFDGTDFGSQPDDVALALAWDFTLDAGETAFISFLLTDLGDPGGTRLFQTDLDSDYTFWFATSIEIRGGEVPVPEPGTLWLLGAGLMALGLSRRRIAKQ